MSLEGARQLDECVFSQGGQILTQPQALQKALSRYSRRINQWHHAWTELVRYFYDGRIFRIHLAGKNLANKPSPFNIASVMERHSTFHIASMASGGYTRSGYSRGLMRMLSKYLVWEVPSAQNFAVRNAWHPPLSQAA